MSFDWLQFLDRHSIEYVTRGPNIAAGEIGIACPFCADDPSQHLAISETRGFYCRRNSEHRGRSPTKLVQALLRCSYEHAQALVEHATFLPDDLIGQVARLLGTAAPVIEPRRKLALPAEFKRLSSKPSARPFINYLRQRRFTDEQIETLHERFGIVYCTQGAFRSRIIFPIVFDNRLMKWTGRSISTQAIVRYKTLSVDPDKAAQDGVDVAVDTLNNYLLFWDRLLASDADTIVLCEGPFDALKTCLHGDGEGVVATCFFTHSPGPKQIELLHELLPRFRRRLLLLDRNTTLQALTISAQLRSLDVGVLTLPPRCKDPGELSRPQLLNLLS